MLASHYDAKDKHDHITSQPKDVGESPQNRRKLRLQGLKSPAMPTPDEAKGLPT